MGPNKIHGQTNQKTVSQHPGRFWTLTCFDNFCGFRRAFEWDHLDRLPYQISFPSICGSSKTGSGCVLGDQFKVDWSWNPRQTRTWVALGLHLGDLDRNSFGPPSWPRHLCWSPTPPYHAPNMVICIGVMSSSIMLHVSSHDIDKRVKALQECNWTAIRIHPSMIHLCIAKADLITRRNQKWMRRCRWARTSITQS